VEAVSKHYNYDEAYLKYICNMYGDRVFDYLNFIKERKDCHLRLHPNLSMLRGEIVYA